MNRMLRNTSIFLGGLLALLLFASNLHAHFIWVYESNGKIQIVFGEGLEPDQAKFLGGLKAMKTYRVVDGKRQLVVFSKQESDKLGWLEKDCAEVGHCIDVHCLYGTFKRGEASMLLDYGAKYVNLASSKVATPGSELKLDLIPEMVEGKLKLTAYFEGKPAKDVELEVSRDAVIDSTISGDDGSAMIDIGSRYVIRAKYTLEKAGELGGAKYDQQRYYCTLVVDNRRPTKVDTAIPMDKKVATNVNAIKKIEAKLPNFPKGMTSFGADFVDGKIYVIGGKSGRAHSYAKAYQNRNVYALATDGSESEWSTVADNLGLQGLAIVGHKGNVYRIGGLEALNEEDKDQELESRAEVKCFDPKTKQWSNLPMLPSPRSSLDACVHGNHIYVVGGWEMGDDQTTWATDMYRLDLSVAESKWEKIGVPFQTRALAVDAFKNKLVVVGGIKQEGNTTNEVHIFDTQTGTWKEGPEIPTQGQMKAFGCSCVTVKDRLFASTYDGGIYELSADGSSWKKVFELNFGRFFHQMVPVADDRFALIGGSHMETGSHFEVEVFELQD